MKHAYWLTNKELCVRPGPNEGPWNAQALFDSGIRAVLSVNSDDRGGAITSCRVFTPPWLAAIYPEAITAVEPITGTGAATPASGS